MLIFIMEISIPGKMVFIYWDGVKGILKLIKSTSHGIAYAEHMMNKQVQPKSKKNPSCYVAAT